MKARGVEMTAMAQATFADLEYQAKKRKTRREEFLEQMDGLIPWRELEAVIQPHYPKAGRGRRPYPLSSMLRVHCVQLFYNVSDPGMEDMLQEVEPVRRFAGLRLDALPDETTICKFRHLLERHGLGDALLSAINASLAEKGLSLKEGTVMDASIVAAPSSTKNRSRSRDPEMHQTRKGNQWHFGMKMHVGADAETGVAHSLVVTAANAADVTQAHLLLHGDEEVAHGDSGYRGVGKRPENEKREVEWEVAMQPGKRAKLEPGSEAALREKAKASIRAKVEHLFFWVKRVFGYCKGALSGPAQEPAADRAAARLRQPAGRPAALGGVNAAPVCPEGAGSARSGVETGRIRRLRARRPAKSRQKPPSATFSRRLVTYSDLP